MGAGGLAYWQEFWIEKTVADITLKEQKRFRSWLAAKNIGAGGIDRILSDGRAALNRAVKWEELTRAPHTHFRTPIGRGQTLSRAHGRPIVPSEIARLFDAAKSRHIVMYLMIAANTLARPGTVLDLRGGQFDEPHRRVDLNPPGRRQNKKFRLILAITPTLFPWLKTVSELSERFFCLWPEAN